MPDTVLIVRYQASRKNLELVLRIDTRLPRYIELDPVRLKQVLIGLLGNAVTCTDTGEVGLALDYTGLGLAIFSALVRRMGGAGRQFWAYTYGCTDAEDGRVPQQAS